MLNSDFDSQRLSREIDAMVRCDHTNIAKLHRVETISLGPDSHLYFIEEFLNGGSLQEKLRAHGVMDSNSVRNLVLELSNALSHLRGLDLVHRDIKPDNVMFRVGTNSPVLVDFGIVRDLAADSLTASFAMQGPGTPLFAAPEQLRNEKCLVDWRTDQFSIGVTASYCLFGHHPYECSGDSANGVIQKVLDRSTVPESFEEECDAVGLGCLAKMVEPWPVRRYRTVDSQIGSWSNRE